MKTDYRFERIPSKIVLNSILPSHLRARKRAILKLARNTVNWCYKTLETSPFWAKNRLFSVIEDSNRFISKFEDNFTDELWEGLISDPNNHIGAFEVACDELELAFFFDNDHFFEASTKGWRHPTDNREYPILKKIVFLCLRMRVKAPPGFHSMIRSSSGNGPEEYMKMLSKI